MHIATDRDAVDAAGYLTATLLAAATAVWCSVKAWRIAHA